MHCAAGFDAILNERMQAGGRGVGLPACESGRCPFRPPAPLSQSMPCPELPCLQRLPRARPGRSRPLQPSQPVDRERIEPSHAAIYAATTRRFDNCPARGPAASPRRWRRSSAWSQTTSPETRRREASAYPGTRCQPSLRSDSRSSNTGTRWHEPPTPCHPRSVDIETPPATAIERGTRDSLLRSRIAPRTLEASAGNLPFGDHTTCGGYLSQVHTQFGKYQAGAHAISPNAARNRLSARHLPARFRKNAEAQDLSFDEVKPSTSDLRHGRDASHFEIFYTGFRSFLKEEV